MSMRSVSARGGVLGLTLSGALAMLGGLAACAVEGPGYGEVDYGYVGGYYEPYGYDYGGWGGRYHVGPPGRGGGRAEGHPDGGRPGGHPGGGGRSAPSIPSRGRGR